MGQHTNLPDLYIFFPLHPTVHFIYQGSIVTLPALQRHNAENSKQIFPEKELRGHSPNFNIHVSVVSDLCIHAVDMPAMQGSVRRASIQIYRIYIFFSFGPYSTLSIKGQ